MAGAVKKFMEIFSDGPTMVDRSIFAATVVTCAVMARHFRSVVRKDRLLTVLVLRKQVILAAIESFKAKSGRSNEELFMFTWQ